MSQTIYLIFDKVAGSVLGAPMLFPNDLSAKRELASLAADKSTIVGRSPYDFDIVSPGILDLETGDIDKPTVGFTRFVCRMVDLLPRHSGDGDD
ncbi:nonstructural protein [Sigmofec virus UA08Rod_5824]|uniref:Nonstructural protein n=1 Tax=Sigmofec virus UA08Rod_5824 TaxID=2929441 RepID=A0A976N0L9_9VIRU|nr:nonstructural protein [Sigmofec virus UA08Rod_5824]